MPRCTGPPAGAWKLQLAVELTDAGRDIAEPLYLEFDIIAAELSAYIFKPGNGGCVCFPGLLCCDPKMLPVLHRTHCT